MSGKVAPKQAGTEWTGLAMDMWWLGIESAMVIGARTTAIMFRTPGHEREAVRMVSEKVRAGIELAGHLVVADPLNPAETARKAVTYYRRKVSANRRRLARKG